MIDPGVKSWLALPIAAIGVFNTLVMLELMGRQKASFDPVKLRLLHRVFGWIGLLWIVFISVMCFAILRGTSGEMTPRGATHAFSASLLLFTILLKILLVRRYRKYYSLIPVMGMILFVLLFTTTLLSSGAYIIGHYSGTEGSSHYHFGNSEMIEKGGRVFNAHCSGCHYPDKSEIKIGPGLKGLSSMKHLPVSGRSVNRENLMRQIDHPVGSMPSFKDLPVAEKDALIEYLLTL